MILGAKKFQMHFLVHRMLKIIKSHACEIHIIWQAKCENFTKIPLNPQKTPKKQVSYPFYRKPP